MSLDALSLDALLPQLVLGLNNGAFYAILSLGLAVIFGLLNVINFAHGAQFMLGAFVTLLGYKYFGISYWLSLAVSPLVVGLLGCVIELTMLRRLANTPSDGVVVFDRKLRAWKIAC